MRRTLAIAALVALLGAACAQARVALLATGTNDVALLDVTTNLVVARPALPGPSRAVAITRDGRRAFAAAGNAVAAFDLGMVPAAPLPGTAAPFAVLTRDLGVPAVGIAVSPGGASVYAAAEPAALRARRPDAGRPPPRAPAGHRARDGALARGDAGGRRPDQRARSDGRHGRAEAAAPREGQGRHRRRLRCRGAGMGQRAAAPVRRAPGRAQAREAPAAPRQGRGGRRRRVARRTHAGRRRRARRQPGRARRRRRASRAPLPLGSRPRCAGLVARRRPRLLRRRRRARRSRS